MHEVINENTARDRLKLCETGDIQAHPQTHCPELSGPRAKTTFQHRGAITKLCPAVETAAGEA